MGAEILNPDGGPNTDHTAENRKIATDIVMNIGEALAGEGNEVAHIDLLADALAGSEFAAVAGSLELRSAKGSIWEVVNQHRT